MSQDPVDRVSDDDAAGASGADAPDESLTAASVQEDSPDEGSPAENQAAEGQPSEGRVVEEQVVEDELVEESVATEEVSSSADPDQDASEPELADDTENTATESAAQESAGDAGEPEAETPAGTPTVASEPESVCEWYVLRVQSGREDSIANNLRKKLSLTQMDHLVEDVVVPKQKVTEIKEGKKRTKKQKLFPGYIFVCASLEDDLWYLIRDSSGIGDFLGSGSKPIPMAQSEVRKILDIMEEKEEAPQVQIDLKKNDTVKITEGPFENFDGVVEEVNPGKGIVRVMVTIFGRSTPVDLEYWQVEKL